ATVTASSGTAPYSYSWNNGGTSSAITALSAGAYIITVTDAAGCTVTNSVTVATTTVTPTVTVSPTSATICNGGSTTLTASGAGTYSWNTGETTTSISVSPSLTTTYTITGTTSGCTGAATVVVTVNPIPNITVSGTTTICNGGSTTLTASGATTYSWTPASSLNNATINNPLASPTSTTTYTVTGSTGTCSAATTVTVTVDPVLTLTVSPATNICNGGSTTLTVSGAATYSWTPAASLNNATMNNPIANPTSTTTYTVIGSNSGCTGSATVVVTVNPIPVITVSPSNSISCPGGAVTLTAGGGTTYLWSTASANTTISVSPTSTITYTVTGTGTNGCTNMATALITVSPISASAGPDLTICPGAMAQLNVSVSGNAPTYLWSPASLLNDPTAQNPLATLDSTTTFIVEVTTNGSCYDIDTITVFVERSVTCVLEFFTGITPNGDGDNDYWHISGIESFPDNHVFIYNNWGGKVWDGSGYDNEEIYWKGDNDQGKPLPSGTYYYVIEMQMNNKKETHSGWVIVTH
ncbi:MAG: gliding motility-associated C-terminal domain-containing protein, partial [Bacteroidota bacterium]